MSDATRETTAAKMAWTINREGPWETLSPERQGLWLGITDDSVKAAMMPRGPKREAAMKKLEGRMKNSGDGR